MKIVYIARYRTAAMMNKIRCMGAVEGVSMTFIMPEAWEDEYGKAPPVNDTAGGRFRTVALPMAGKVTDPHRAFYKTLTFGLRGTAPDIIHAEEEPDSLSALQICVARRLFAPRSRLILHTWQNVNRNKKWYVRSVSAFCLRCCDAVLSANTEGITVLRQMGYHGPAEVIPPYGVDMKFFAPRDGSKRGDVFTIAYMGRFVPEKGIETLVEACALLGGRVRLLLVGGGPREAPLREMVASRNLRDSVEFPGPVSPDDVPGFLSAVDALVLPSLTTAVWKEQFGRVLVEAMACGVPVIGSDSGAIREVVGDGGLIFPEGDARALCRCLERLVHSRELCEHLARKGLERVAREYSLEKVVDKTVAFYRAMGRY